MLFRSSRLPGITAYMQPVQDLTIEDRVSKTQYQFSLSSQDPQALATTTADLITRLKQLPQLADVASDLQEQGLQAFVQIDREAAREEIETPAELWGPEQLVFE